MKVGISKFLNGVGKGVEIVDIQKLGEKVDNEDDANKPVPSRISEMSDVNRAFTKCIIQSMMYLDFAF